MVATTRRPERSGPGGQLLRFDRVERALHWVNAALFAVLMFTGATLYLDSLSRLIGRRALIEDIHLYCGLALPVPLAVAVWGRWGRGLRADIRRWNRWALADRLWLAAHLRGAEGRRRLMSQLEQGKFNAGQKLNAAFVAGAGLVMLGTGAIMYWYHPWPLAWRTGATFVHDWLAGAVFVVVIGHVGMALRDPDALRSMLTGRISRPWAARHAPAWLDGRDAPGPGAESPARPGRP